MAELTPTSSPFMLTSAPPELPGLIAASVWIASSTVFWFCASPPAATGRLSALTMPVVTVPSRPSGEPIATTSWPTRRLPDEPSVMGVSPVAPVGPHDGDVTAGIGADHRERRGVAVGEGDLGLGTARRAAVLGGGDHVVVGEDESVGRQDDARALLGLPAHVGLELDHAGHHLGGDLLDRAGGQVRRGLAGRRTGRRWCRSRAAVRLHQHGHTAADTGGHQRDRQRAERSKRPARERFWGAAGTAAHRHRSRLGSAAAVRVVRAAVGCCWVA